MTTNSLNNLIARIESKDAVIGIVGMGYVGQPLALRYSQIGFNVLGFDIDKTKVDELNSGHSGIALPPVRKTNVKKMANKTKGEGVGQPDLALIMAHLSIQAANDFPRHGGIEFGR